MRRLDPVITTGQALYDAVPVGSALPETRLGWWMVSVFIEILFVLQLGRSIGPTSRLGR